MAEVTNPAIAAIQDGFRKTPAATETTKTGRTATSAESSRLPATGAYDCDHMVLDYTRSHPVFCYESLEKRDSASGQSDAEPHGEEKMAAYLAAADGCSALVKQRWKVKVKINPANSSPILMKKGPLP